MSGTYNKGYTQSTIKKTKTATYKRDEPKWQIRHLDYVPTRTRHVRRDVSTTFDSYEACSTGRLDYVSTRTRHARRDISTTFRLVRVTSDGTSRSRSDSYEARSIRHPTIGKSPTRTTPGWATRPTLFTNSETKVRAFNATTHYFLPSWLQQ
jgi:hypothetical protein